MNILMFTGSRKHYPRDLICNVFHEEGLHREGYPDLVIVGDAQGVDLAVVHICRNWNIPCAKFAAAWDTLGFAAGPERNQAMVDAMVCLGGKRVYAFPSADSKGTRHAISAARKAALDVVVTELT